MENLLKSGVEVKKEGRQEEIQFWPISSNTE